MKSAITPENVGSSGKRSRPPRVDRATRELAITRWLWHDSAAGGRQVMRFTSPVSSTGVYMLLEKIKKIGAVQHCIEPANFFKQFLKSVQCSSDS